MKSDFLSGHKVELLRSGKEYFDALVSLIENATSTIHLQVYIFDLDQTGKEVLQAVLDAAMRGVKIFMVVDGFGSMRFSDADVKQLRSAGVLFRFFSPLPFPGVLQPGRRLHHKVLVVDDCKALVGGINIADKYRGVFPEIAWLDYAVLVEGPVVGQIRDYCLKLYFRKFHVPAKFRLPASLPNALSKRGSSARMRINDWFRGKNQISSSYKKQIRAAKTEVFIMASYFLPTRRLLKIILQAAGKGVRVTLVLGKYSDVVLMKPAMRYLYNVLLRNNVEVYEYESSVLHAKVCVVDREWVSVGSHNLNHLSEWMSLEMNVEVQDKAFAKDVLLKISNDLSSTARRVEKESGMDISGRRWHLWWSYKIVSWSMRLLYFLQGRDKRR